ncbi:hypothetical protein BV898_06301 [Hypsibius exemplaris]|uniref:EGF-like domain-containing protein n=1 Tax=Hypsibius exemplaris TaxID=2072580 RepID=A0A1W0WX83_HYPEX|nr:hypothetical protein BV898_06301 [Hypsibius exemplaris]
MFFSAPLLRLTVFAVTFLFSCVLGIDGPQNKCISPSAPACTRDQECIDACGTDGLGDGKCGKFRSTSLCYCNGCAEVNTMLFPSQTRTSTAASISQTRELLCGGTIYDPALSVCLGGKNLCLVGQLACRNGTTAATCYDPSEKTCFTGLLCLAGETRCGDECMDPMIKTCVRSDKCGNGKGICTCPRGNELCDGECYDATKEICTENYPSPLKNNDKRCKIGGLPCGDECIDVAERTCFSTSQCDVNGNTKPCFCRNGQIPYKSGCALPAAPQS